MTEKKNFPLSKFHGIGIECRGTETPLPFTGIKKAQEVAIAIFPRRSLKDLVVLL